MTYTIKQVAMLVGKSANLIYRRLTENPRRYAIRYARKEGGGWVFDKQLVDAAILKGESIITRIHEEKKLDNEELLRYFNSESRSCGRSLV